MNLIYAIVTISFCYSVSSSPVATSIEGKAPLDGDLRDGVNGTLIHIYLLKKFLELKFMV